MQEETKTLTREEEIFAMGFIGGYCKAAGLEAFLWDKHMKLIREQAKDTGTIGRTFREDICGNIERVLLAIDDEANRV